MSRTVAPGPVAAAWKALAGMVAGDVVRDMLAGRLGPREAWTAFRGAGRYLRALADGHGQADHEAADLHAGLCGGCPAATRGGAVALLIDGRPITRRAVYCGPMLVDRTDGPVDQRTCGCLVAIEDRDVSDGAPKYDEKVVHRPAGKTMLRGQACPRRVWGDGADANE